jgi:hypothetical protein
MMSLIPLPVTNDWSEADRKAFLGYVQRVANSPLPPEEKKRRIEQLSSAISSVPPADRSSVLSELENRLRGSVAATKVSPLGAAAMGALQGFTFDFGDELAAAISSVLRGRPYAEEKAAARQLFKDVLEQNPVSGYSGYAAGGLAAPALGRLLPFASKAPVLAEAVAQGAATAAGQAETPTQAITAGLHGGLLGGAVGGAAGALGRLGAAAYNKLASLTARGAEEEMARRAAQSGVTKELVDRTMAEAAPLDQPVKLIDIAGPDSRLTRYVEAAFAKGAPEAQTQAARMLADRVATMSDRVSAYVGSMLRSRIPNAEEAKKFIIDEIDQTLQPAFSAVLSKQGDSIITDPKVIGLFDRDFVKRGLKKAVSLMRDAGEQPLVMTDKDGVVSGISLRTFDYLRKVLADAVYRGVDPRATNRSLLKSELVIGRKILGEMTDAVRAQFPDYADLLSQYSKMFALRDAIDLGVRAANSKAEEGIQLFRQLTEPEAQRMFAVGFFSERLSRSYKNPPASLRGDPGKQLLTDAIIKTLQGQEKLEAFKRFLEREAVMREVGAQVASGSPTARRLATLNEAFGMLPTSKWDLMKGALGAVSDKWASQSADTALRLGLLSDPRDAMAVLSAAAQRDAARRAAQQNAIMRAAPLFGRFGTTIGGGGYDLRKPY